jgi:hypothetical protein
MTLFTAPLHRAFVRIFMAGGTALHLREIA